MNKNNTIRVSGNNDKAKKIAIASGAGILLGTAGAVAATTIHARMSDDDDEAEVLEEGQLAFATNVDDSMSYEDAFAAARDEVGPGGCFVWHGQVWSTYTSEEWEQLSDDEKAEFAHNAFGDELPEEDTEEVAQASAAAARPSYHQAAAAHHTAQLVEDEDDTDTDGDLTNDDDDDGEMHVISVGQDQIGDGIYNTAETVEGGVHYTYIDTDSDEYYDLKVHDADNDGIITDDEAEDIRDQGISVDHMVQAAVEETQHIKEEIQNYQADVDDLPDYTNDADVSDLT